MLNEAADLTIDLSETPQRNKIPRAAIPADLPESTGASVTAESEYWDTVSRQPGDRDSIHSTGDTLFWDADTHLDTVLEEEDTYDDEGGFKGRKPSLPRHLKSPEDTAKPIAEVEQTTDLIAEVLAMMKGDKKQQQQAAPPSAAKQRYQIVLQKTTGKDTVETNPSNRIVMQRPYSTPESGTIIPSTSVQSEQKFEPSETPQSEISRLGPLTKETDRMQGGASITSPQGSFDTDSKFQEHQVLSVKYPRDTYVSDKNSQASLSANTSQPTSLNSQGTSDRFPKIVKPFEVITKPVDVSSVSGNKPDLFEYFGKIPNTKIDSKKSTNTDGSRISGSINSGKINIIRQENPSESVTVPSVNTELKPVETKAPNIEIKRSIPEIKSPKFEYSHTGTKILNEDLSVSDPSFTQEISPESGTILQVHKVKKPEPVEVKSPNFEMKSSIPVVKSEKPTIQTSKPQIRGDIAVPNPRLQSEKPIKRDVVLPVHTAKIPEQITTQPTSDEIKSHIPVMKLSKSVVEATKPQTSGGIDVPDLLIQKEIPKESVAVLPVQTDKKREPNENKAPSVDLNVSKPDMKIKKMKPIKVSGIPKVSDEIMPVTVPKVDLQAKIKTPSVPDEDNHLYENLPIIPAESPKISDIPPLPLSATTNYGESFMKPAVGTSISAPKIEAKVQSPSGPPPVKPATYRPPPLRTSVLPPGAPQPVTAKKPGPLQKVSQNPAVQAKFIARRKSRQESSSSESSSGSGSYTTGSTSDTDSSGTYEESVTSLPTSKNLPPAKFTASPPESVLSIGSEMAKSYEEFPMEPVKLKPSAVPKPPQQARVVPMVRAAVQGAAPPSSRNPNTVVSLARMESISLNDIAPKEKNEPSIVSSGRSIDSYGLNSTNNMRSPPLHSKPPPEIVSSGPQPKNSSLRYSQSSGLENPAYSGTLPSLGRTGSVSFREKPEVGLTQKGWEPVTRGKYPWQDHRKKWFIPVCILAALLIILAIVLGSVIPNLPK